MGNGLVERINRSLLTLLRSYTETSANTSTPEEFASQMKQCPDVLEQTAEGLSSDDNATIITTRSGRVVKPVERFGWT